MIDLQLGMRHPRHAVGPDEPEPAARSQGYREGAFREPYEKEPEYRQVGMARAHVYIDHMFDPPSHIDELRCHIIRDAYGSASELKGIPLKLKERVRDIFGDYLCRCRELARDAKGEWKSALLEGVFQRLVKLFRAGHSPPAHRTSRGEQSSNLNHHHSKTYYHTQRQGCVQLLTSRRRPRQPSILLVHPPRPSEIETTTSETTAVSTIDKSTRTIR
jgi:hypothetical protein